MSHILCRNDHHNAWWPVEISSATISFENNQVYKIYGQLYTANTGPFREAWYIASRELTWEALNKKEPKGPFR